MWKNKQKDAMIESLCAEIVELREQNTELRNELTWAEGEIDFLNRWEEEHRVELRWYERMLRKVIS